ncbi:integral membrane protein GPR155-like [Notolabrus celidotus]|uniref:integral membrane protein GPR155-like n=1 Tax=Notolabrus celidotus TaxID=1203425 RepID=UPI00148F8363|nr:integral membrane protein GPR155-like [Notolabrus celidotus]
MSFERLFPAIVECFGIIVCGYVAGRVNIITPTQAKGLGSFVSTFALPALLFKNMVLLDFGNVVWPFLWSILVAKLCVFLLVGVLTLIVASPEKRYSQAGIFSIFATQSNDFALGYPIVEALYKSTYPHYLQYIYLIAPVSLILLNPIGFAFCEIQKWKNEGNHQQSKLLTVGCVVLQVLKNPIVFMVIIGLITHFVLHHNIPPFLAEFVNCLASSFGGTALFYLGLSMVGQLRKLTRGDFMTMTLLLTAKLLLMPLICKDMVEQLDNSNTSASDHSSLSNYAFLYGVFPTAPSVAIYAVYYNAELEVVTSGMVISTFLSAPIMYVSAWLLSICQMDSKLVLNSLQSVTINISVLSLVLLIWTIAIILLSQKVKRLPHLFTFNLFLAQFMTCIGMILWDFMVTSDKDLGQVLTVAILCTSLYSTYVWPALIALSLVLMKRYEEKVSPGLFVLAGWGIPAFVTAVLLFSGEEMTDTIDTSFIYGKQQIICTSVVASLSIVLGGVSLLCLSKGSRTRKEYSQEGNSSDYLVSEVEHESKTKFVLVNPFGELSRGRNENKYAYKDYPHFHMDELQQVEDKQEARHEILCLFLIVSLLANLCSCLWLLLYRAPGRLYLELQFFCAVANYGQGFLSFAVFGLDKHLMALLFKRIGKTDFRSPNMAAKRRLANRALKRRKTDKAPTNGPPVAIPPELQRLNSSILGKKDLEQKKGERTLLASSTKYCTQEEKKVMIHYLSPMPDQPSDKEDPRPSGSETQHQGKDSRRKKRLKTKHVDP